MTGTAQRLVRREQGWELSFSRKGIGFRRFAYVDGQAAARWSQQVLVRRPESRSRGRLAWAASVLGCVSLAAGVIAAPNRMAHAYSIVLPVPAAPATERSFTVPADARLGSGRNHHRVTAAVERPRETLSTDDGQVASAKAAPPESHFVSLAMQSGEMQAWRAGSTRYFLVAGDLQTAGDKACRQFSLMTRPDAGGDSVRQFERCRPAD